MLLAVALLPDQRAADTVGHGLLAEFRSAEIEQMVPPAMSAYGTLCGETLARARAQR